MNFQRNLSFVIALLLALAIPTKSYAQTKAKADEREIGRLLDHYATVAGGWYLNEQCHFLSVQDGTELTWHVERINLGMHQLIDAAFLSRLRQSGKATAESPKYAQCDADARRVVQEVLILARAFSHALTGERYSPAKPLLETWETHYELAWLGMKIEEQCPRLPASLMSDVHRVFDAIRARLQQSQDAAVAAALEQRAEDTMASMEKKSSVCSTATESLVMNALGMIRMLEKEKPAVPAPTDK